MTEKDKNKWADTVRKWKGLAIAETWGQTLYRNITIQSENGKPPDFWSEYSNGHFTNIHISLKYIFHYYLYIYMWLYTHVYIFEAHKKMPNIIGH